MYRWAWLVQVTAPNTLDDVIGQINTHLALSANRVFGRYHYQQCYRSWLKITTQLARFHQEPKHQYSNLMYLIETEISKFPNTTFYPKALQALAQILAQGTYASIRIKP